jgi:hypothetical protein
VVGKTWKIITKQDAEHALKKDIVLSHTKTDQMQECIVITMNQMVL